MASKLKQVFHDRIELNVYGKKEINSSVISKTDFFVSSIALNEETIPTVFVNPFLNGEDMERIHKLVYEYERLPEKESDRDTLSVQREEIAHMADQINEVLCHFSCFELNHEISFEALLEFLGEVFSVSQETKELVIRDLKNREMIATQVYETFGFALFHSRSQGVKSPTLGVCLPKQEKSFKNYYFKGIKVIFVMLIPEDENIDVNSELLGYLSSLLLEENSFLETMLNGNASLIKETISDQLKAFYQEKLNRITQAK